jgi:hypothetical protein
MSHVSGKLFSFRHLGILAHKSIIPLSLMRKEKRYSSFFFFIIITTALVLSYNLSAFLDVSGLANHHKISYYAKDLKSISYSTIGVPSHYIAVLLASLYLYYKTDEKAFIFSTNAIFILFAAAVFFAPMNMGYRMSMFMTPFVALNIGFILFKSLRSGKEVMFLLCAIYVLLLAILGMKNIDKIIYHL